MKRYEIEMERTVKYSLRVVVNAESEDEARVRAYKLDYDEELVESDGNTIDWKVLSVEDFGEVE